MGVIKERLKETLHMERRIRDEMERTSLAREIIICSKEEDGPRELRC